MALWLTTRRQRYTEEQAPVEDAPAEAHTRYENRRQEQQVRLTAQNILSRNLRIASQPRRHWWHRTPPPAIPAWPEIRLDLTGALLSEFSLFRCQLDGADFMRAQFTGMAIFGDVQFTGAANFQNAQFTGGANFQNAQFPGMTMFGGAQFTGGANFQDAQFTGKPSFKGARVASATEPGTVWPPGWTTRPAKPYIGEDPAFRYLARMEDGKPPDT